MLEHVSLIDCRDFALSESYQGFKLTVHTIRCVLNATLFKKELPANEKLQVLRNLTGINAAFHISATHLIDIFDGYIALTVRDRKTCALVLINSESS
jgi:hypothetical protein